MSIIIQACGLGKEYHRTHLQQYGDGLRHLMDRFLRSPWQFFRRQECEESFWALRDVSFEVHQGEVLGLIGRNGAGKSTLLKILSRITRPTTGWAEIRGRVGSLLEVGTGFHPELTGRENVFLNGAILGMPKQEITSKFDEIVAFAEIEKFIDTPVKRYSSGMYVRLAFAVAAHLEPEILLVDEVLAVGDLGFQKKCLGKIKEVSGEGRSIVLVSHQMNQVRRLCQRVAWVDDGVIKKIGPGHEVVSTYEAAMSRGHGRSVEANGGQRSSGNPDPKGRFLQWEILGSAHNPHELDWVGPVTLKFSLKIQSLISRGHYGIALRNSQQQLIWAWATEPLRLEVGEHELRHTFPMLPLRPGLYNWLATLYDDGRLVDWWDCTPEMAVATEVQQHPRDEWNGILNLPAGFEISCVSGQGQVSQTRSKASRAGFGSECDGN